MKKILISTIMRDSAKNIDVWYNNIKELCRIDKNNKYYLSVYENDSKDKTLEKLKNFDLKLPKTTLL